MSRSILAKRPEARDAVILRDALQAVPVPCVGADFDDRVLAAVRAPRPWWMTLWGAMRPVLASAACSMCAMLVLITWSTKSPVGLEPLRLTALHPNATMASAPVVLGDLDRLDGKAPTRANLMAALLIAPDAAAAPAPPPLPPRKAPELPRVRRLSCAPYLLA